MLIHKLCKIYVGRPIYLSPSGSRIEVFRAGCWELYALHEDVTWWKKQRMWKRAVYHLLHGYTYKQTTILHHPFTSILQSSCVGTLWQYCSWLYTMNVRAYQGDASCAVQCSINEYSTGTGWHKIDSEYFKKICRHITQGFRDTDIYYEGVKFDLPLPQIPSMGVCWNGVHRVQRRQPEKGNMTTWNIYKFLWILSIWTDNTSPRGTC